MGYSWLEESKNTGLLSCDRPSIVHYSNLLSNRAPLDIKVHAEKPERSFAQIHAIALKYKYMAQSKNFWNALV